MFKRILLLSLSFGCCLGVTCTITPGTGNSDSSVPLDQAIAAIRITRIASKLLADVVATITDTRLVAVHLDTDQDVAVNDESLQGPNLLGGYSRTISAADTYTVRVTEPTRGVEETTISAPAAFDITAPATNDTVSLSGFTITWSNPDATLQVKVTLTQTIFGSQRTQTFDPFVDTGTLPLDADDLSRFRQGANLQVALTKINERAGINGFSVGTLSAELTQAVVVVPGP